MALSKTNLTSKTGLTIPKSYIRINSFEGSKYSVRIHIGVYNLVNEEVEKITPTEKEVEVTLEDGTTEMQTVIENIVTKETVEVKKQVEEDYLDIVPNLTDTLNILQQGYTELKNVERFSGAIDC